MIKNKSVLTLILIISIPFISCKRKPKIEAIKVEKHDNKNGLIKHQIGKSNFYIYLPKEYSIKEREGPDFSIFYFLPTDTIFKATFSGGLYFGNHPSIFPPDNVSCKIESIKSKILNETMTWTVYNCEINLSAQTIINNKKSQGWDEKIHAFGSANSQEDLEKVLKFFSTME